MPGRAAITLERVDIETQFLHQPLSTYPGYYHIALRKKFAYTLYSTVIKISNNRDTTDKRSFMN